MAKQPLKPASRDELPRSLFPARVEPLRRYNEQELEALASRPQKLVPLPEGLTESQRKRMANLAQFKGRSAEGNKASLGNLPRKVKMEQISEQPPVQPEGVPAPAVPAVFPNVPIQKTITGRMARRVLSKEEYDLYTETWNNWMIAHPEFDNVEDKDDVAQIAMDTVLMFRLQQLVVQKPTLDISEPYNQSYRRKQQARQNLAARRSDRLAQKQNQGGTVINVAVLTGQISQADIQKRKERLIADEQRELRFLEGTVVNPQKTLEEKEEAKE